MSMGGKLFKSTPPPEDLPPSEPHKAPSAGEQTPDPKPAEHGKTPTEKASPPVSKTPSAGEQTRNQPKPKISKHGGTPTEKASRPSVSMTPSAGEQTRNQPKPKTSEHGGTPTKKASGRPVSESSQTESGKGDPKPTGSLPKDVFSGGGHQKKVWHWQPTFQKKRTWQEEKAMIESWDLDTKRKNYKCKSTFVTLDAIPTWSNVASEGLPAVAKDWTAQASKRKSPQYLVLPDLNERVSYYRGDITKLEIDCIANAANERLMGGGGVDGAIHAAAGQYLKWECQPHSPITAGQAIITHGYKLPAKCVIHTVGPRYENPEALSSCYKRSLNLMKEHGLKSVAFPCISTGIFGYPMEAAAAVALKTVRQWMNEQGEDLKIERVIFCLFSESDVQCYEELLPVYFPLESYFSVQKSFIDKKEGSLDVPCQAVSHSEKPCDNLTGSQSLPSGNELDTNNDKAVTMNLSQQDSGMQANESPMQSEDSIAQKSDLPMQDDDAPMQEDDSPMQEDDSHVPQGDSPMAKDVLPMQECDSPMLENNSPMVVDDLPTESVDKKQAAPAKTSEEEMDVPMEIAEDHDDQGARAALPSEQNVQDRADPASKHMDN